jgi:hypothetical protein
MVIGQVAQSIVGIVSTTVMTAAASFSFNRTMVRPPASAKV